jgi:cell division septum initiation protein DivIVA
MDTGVNRISGSAPADATSTPVDGSRAAAHLLEMAARDADEWRSEARSEAAAVVEDAKAEAAQLVQAAHNEARRLTTSAHQLRTSAQAEADALLEDAHTEAKRVHAELEQTRRRHDTEIAELQQLEDGHRERLRRNLIELLEQVDAQRSGDAT